MAEDTRTNEQIITEGLHSGGVRGVVAALAAAGRLVTPEHDAQVLRDAARESPFLTSTHREALDARAAWIEKGANS